jgi:hypothetical protein
MSSPVHTDPIDTYVSPYSPVHIDPIDTYMSPYFWEHDTVAAIIHHFELYNVSDLADLSDDMIESARVDLDLSYGEISILKRLRDAQQSTPGPELASQSLCALLTRLRDI